METCYEVWVKLRQGGWETVLDEHKNDRFGRRRADEIAAAKAGVEGVEEVVVVERRAVARLNGPPPGRGKVEAKETEA